VENIPVKGEITLAQFLKFAGVAETGGHAKELIAAGEVRVNGEPESRRGRKLRHGDRVELPGAEFILAATD
jgi:ribosome-associated protein